MTELWTYQKQAVQHVLKKIVEDYFRMYVTLPTGTGKSIILVALAALRVLVGRVLVLIHRQEIAIQLVKALREANLDVGLVMQGHRELGAPVVVATPQSLSSEMLKALIDANEQPIATVLIDEAHHAVAGSAYARILDWLEVVPHQVPIVAVGFTATPYRSDTRTMFSVLPTCAFARDIPDMTREGYLSPLRWEPLRIKLDLQNIVRTTREGETDYDENTLAATLDITDITEAIARKVVVSIGQRPTLLFAASVEHAEHFAEAFRRLGSNAHAVSGKQSLAQRERVFTDWRNGVLQIVCNCSLLTEGFDFPAISALVIARPTLSPSLYMQMLGRGIRLATGKKDCLVLDVMGNDPDTSKQIVLPHLVGDIEGEGAIGPQSSEPLETLPHLVSDAQGKDSRVYSPKRTSIDPLLKAIYGTDTLSLSLLDPVGQSQYRWIPYRLHGYEGYLARISQYEGAIIERDPEGSGLYRSRLHEKQPRQTATDTWIEHQYLPLRQQVALVHEATHAHYSKALGGKESKWLREPATEKQLQVLYRMHSRAAREAKTKAWTGQKVSDLITFLSMRGTLTHPPPLPQEMPNDGA